MLELSIRVVKRKLEFVRFARGRHSRDQETVALTVSGWVREIACLRLGGSRTSYKNKIMINFLAFLLRCVVILGLLGCWVVINGFWLKDQHWAFDLAAQFLLPVIVTACVLALMAGLARGPVLAALSLGIAVIAALSSAPWTQAPRAEAGRAPQFSVLLFNTWYANPKLDQVEQMIRRENADLVVLLEATPRLKEGLKRLTEVYPYRLDCIGNRSCDALVFSRSRLELDNVRFTQDAEHSPLVSFKATLGGCPMMVYATHLTRPFPNQPYEAQREQAREIAANVAEWKGSKLLLGDFNGAPWGYVMQTIVSRADVKLLTGPGGTWPSVLPQQLRIPIDHMLAGPGLEFVSRKVLASPGSDHSPVKGQVAVVNPAQCM
jgi:endonuclease/exonuclease/phosphatase (EEP) superfamily protein YafD